MAPPQVPHSLETDGGEVRRKYSLPKRYFIYPAAVWPHKNHMNLIRGIKLSLKEIPDIYCICTGENADWLYPEQFVKIEEEIKRNGLDKNVRFLGSVPYQELYALEKEAEFFCVPSFYEAGCYPIWEACQFGKAVACSNVTMIPYQIQDAGILFDPNDTHEIAQAIRLLWKDDTLRQKLGRKAKTLVENPLYSSRRMALGYHRAFVNTLIRLGRISAQHKIDEDPASPLDRFLNPPRFEWENLKTF